MSAVQFERPNGVPLLLNPGKKHQGGITAKYQILAATEDEIFERCEEDFCCPCRVGGPNPRPRCLARDKVSKLINHPHGAPSRR